MEVAEGNTSRSALEGRNQLYRNADRSFGVRLDALDVGEAGSGNPDDAILMESPAGTLKLKQGKTGKLGFTKEHYDSTFDYVVPEDKWTHILLKGDNKGVTLFVNVDEYVERLENAYPRLHTLVLPALRIGSETNAFRGA